MSPLVLAKDAAGVDTSEGPEFIGLFAEGPDQPHTTPGTWTTDHNNLYSDHDAGQPRQHWAASTGFIRLLVKKPLVSPHSYSLKICRLKYNPKTKSKGEPDAQIYGCRPPCKDEDGHFESWYV